MKSRFCLLVMAAIWGCSKEPERATTPATTPKTVQASPESDTRPASAASSPPAASLPPQRPNPAVANSSTPSPADVTTRIADQQKNSALKSILNGALTTSINGDRNDSLRHALMPIRESLTLIDISTRPQTPKWNHVKLNQLGTRFDAIRFHTPAGARSDLLLSICCDGILDGWNLLDFSARQRDLTDHVVEWNATIEGLAAPAENRLILYADQREFEPDADYCLWFNLGGTDPRELDVAVTLLPHDESRHAITPAQVAALMGITYRVPQFTGTPAGAKQSLNFAKSLWKRRAAGNDRFRQALVSAAAGFPELNVGLDGKVAWNEIDLNRSGIGFDAYRFRSPLPGPADLHYVIAEPQGQDLGYGVASLEGFKEGGRFHLEIDLQLAGTKLPPRNVTLFELLPFGQVAPQQDYVFWVDSTAEKQEKTVLGLHVSTPTPPPQPVTTAALAAPMGISLPKTIAPERRDAALRKCREWCLGRGDLENNLLRCGLQSVARNLPEIQVTNGDQPLSWNAVRLNANGIAFDAVRFKSSVDHPTEFYCAFADSRDLRWQLVSAVANQTRVDNIYRASGAVFEGIPVPPASQLTVASGSWGQPGRMIEPGREYILWFLSPEGAQPRDLKLAVHLMPHTTPVWFKTAAEIAARIGLQASSGQAHAGNILLGKHAKAVIDLAFAPDGRSLASLDGAGNLNWWDVERRSLTASIPIKGNRWGRCVKVLPDGRTVALALNNPSEIVFWDIAAKRIASRITLSGLFVLDVAFSPDAGRVAVAQGERRGAEFLSSLSIWDVGRKRQVLSKSLDGPRFDRLAWPVADRIVGVGLKPTKVEGPGVFSAAVVGVFYPATLKPVDEAQEQLSSFDDLSISGPPYVVAASGNPRMLKLWNLDKFEALPPLPLFGMPGTPHNLPGRAALSADGRFVALSTIGWDLQYWDLAARRMLFMRPAHEGEIGRLAISPDGKWIASCGKDLTVQLWDTQFPASSAVENSLGMKLMPVSTGSFLMGSPDKEMGRDAQREGPQHEVRISRPFLMGAHEVTVAQFRQFVDASGYKTTAETNGSGGAHIYETAKGFEYRPELTWRSPGFSQDDSHPVVQITWDDAQAFCRWLTTKEGVAYRLPTEAEWEYACRAGTTGEYFYNDSAYFLANVANTADRALLKVYRDYRAAASTLDDRFAYTAPVGTYAANGFGLSDMHGNVWEWCSDWFDAQFYATSAGADPSGPATGKNRVLRGGGFFNGTWQARSACREFDPPTKARSNVGFRVVREIEAANESQ